MSGGVAKRVKEDGVHPCEVELDAEGRQLVAHPFSRVSTALSVVSGKRGTHKPA